MPVLCFTWNFRGLLLAEIVRESCPGPPRSTQVNCQTSADNACRRGNTFVNGSSTGSWKPAPALGCTEPLPVAGPRPAWGGCGRGWRMAALRKCWGLRGRAAIHTATLAPEPRWHIWHRVTVQPLFVSAALLVSRRLESQLAWETATVAGETQVSQQKKFCHLQASQSLWWVGGVS